MVERDTDTASRLMTEPLARVAQAAGDWRFQNLYYGAVKEERIPDVLADIAHTYALDPEQIIEAMCLVVHIEDCYE